ncbi:MAG: 2-isopropylmalate synthase [Spirochaetota bacterium]
MDEIVVFDTTLRDGEQSPGASMTVEQKIEVARVLAAMGVDVIEAGFPISSPKQFEGVKRIAESVQGAVICGLARSLEKDITTCYEALRKAKRRRIHTFIATSDIHLEHKLKKTKEQVLDLAANAVTLAASMTDDVEFSAEDATRSDWDYLVEVFTAAIEAGARTINVPDTVGYTTPGEYVKLIRHLKERVRGIENVVISVHCHNDLGLATANSLQALVAGARQVEVAVNGIGERAGNASLEEVVMSLKTREDAFGLHTGVKTEQIYHLSKLVTSFTGIHVQPNKAIVGENAFAHEAGIHQDGMIKNRMTYEIMRPEDIGRQKSMLVLGRHSGKHGLKVRLSELGYSLSEKEFADVYEKFLEIADKKKQVYDDDLMALMEEELNILPEIYSLAYFSVVTGDKVIPTATVRLKKKNTVMEEAATGDGPVDAVYRAIEKITGLNLRLLSWSTNAVTTGKDAMGSVTLLVSRNERTFRGYGVATDVIEASAHAYLNAINRILNDSPE